MALAYALSLVVSVTLILTLPILGSTGLAGTRTWVYIALAIVPFAAGGFTVAGLFRRFPQGGSLLYAADLAGAAAGALLVVPAMDAWGGVNVVFLAAAVAAGGALLLGVPRLRRVLLALAAAVVFGGLFVALAQSGAGPTRPDRQRSQQGDAGDDLRPQPGRQESSRAAGARLVGRTW